MPNLTDFIYILSLTPFELVLVVIALFFIIISLFVYRYFLNQTPQDILAKSQQKGYDLIHSAIKKGEVIITQAELDSVKIAAERDLKTRNLQNTYALELKQTIKESEQSVREAQQQFKAYLDTLGKEAGSSVSETEEVLKAQINKMFETFEQNLSTFLTQSQTQSAQAIALEMQSARTLIETYKKQQFRLIDENIVAMLEQTLSLVLVKKLSLKDHVDLIYEALEQAKTEKFFM